MGSACQVQSVDGSLELADQLGGGLLTYEGTQHTVVFQGNSCVDDHAAGYLVNGVVPEAGAKC